MSKSPRADGNQAPKAATKSPSKKDLSGLMPYLRRYPGGIIVGLLVVVLMSVIGNVLPLATGIMTDTLAGNPVPFEHSAGTHGAAAWVRCRGSDHVGRAGRTRHHRSTVGRKRL